MRTLRSPSWSSICPVEVERRLQLNQARFADYLEAQKELSTYLETRIGLLKSGGGGHSSSDYNGHRRACRRRQEECHVP